MNLTRRQSEILMFLREFIDTKRYSPTIKEICRHFGLTSTETVHRHLKNLEERGVIRRDSNRSRAIEVIPEESRNHTLDVVLEGIVDEECCIQPAPAREHVPVPATLVEQGRAFALRVDGNGLRDHCIRSGDYLLAVVRRNPPDGATVLVSLREEAPIQIRQIFRLPGKLKLVPLDGLGPPQTVSAAMVHVRGVLSGILRRY